MKFFSNVFLKKPVFAVSRLRRRGFTLIELMVVISMLGLFASISFLSASQSLERGRDAKRKSDMDALKKAMSLYFSDNSRYPDPGPNLISNSLQPNWLPGLVPKYIKELPKDPKQASLPTPLDKAGINKPQVAGAAVPPSTNSSYNMPVLVLKYFPTKDGVNLDSSVTGVVSSLASIRTKVNRITSETKSGLQAGSTYHGYKDAAATPALNYSIYEEREYLQTLPLGIEVPWKPGQGIYRPDYGKILTDLNICNYVNNQGLREVWLYGWHYGNIEPAESAMSGPYGDISNSGGGNLNMPVCSKTYVLYNYSYARDTQEALHNHGHQIEVMMKNVGDPLFENNFIGPFSTYGANDGSGTNYHRCGWTHTPPNTSGDYDYGNSRYSWTDCENWSPDGSGAKVNINCNRWQCSERRYHTWRWQNMPGKNNAVAGASNWWDFVGDFDHAKDTGEKLIYDVIPPSVPTGLAASNVYSTQLNLSWNASSDFFGVAGYTIRRNGQIVGSTAAAEFTDYTVSAGTTYQYTVSAVDVSELVSAESAPLPVTTNSASAPDATRPILDSYTYMIGNTAASYSWQHAVGNGSNRFLIVGVGIRNGSSVQVSGVTYKGTPLTRLGFKDIGGSLRTEFWTLKNPDTGLNTITVTLSGPPWGSVGGASSWVDVNQANPTGVMASNAGASATPGVTVESSTTDVVVDSLVMPNRATDVATAGSSQTVFWNAFASTGDTREMGSMKNGSSGNTQMSWSLKDKDGASKSEGFAMIGVALKFGAPPPPPFIPPPPPPPPPPPETNCPSQDNVYCYVVSENGNSFTLWGKLENINDKQIWNKPGAVCGNTPGDIAHYNYCVVNQ